MREAIISDIHGNYEALKAVFEDIRKNNIEKVTSLGDQVGYGPQPAEVVKYLRSNDVDCILGNHDSALLNEEELICFARHSKKSILVTKELLSEKMIDSFREFPEMIIRENVLYAHGCPFHDRWGYLTKVRNLKLTKIFEEMVPNLAFVGHTHELKLYTYNDEEINKSNLEEGIYNLDKKKKIINVGSVGQPRDDKNNKAKYVIFDSEQNTLEVRAIEYDVQKTVELIKKLDFPKFNWERLL